ncbi:hypothetical protein RJ639_034842 [Escallonia herrerae]|uniref:Uncharacterized protein n=1 Tax=Escallonia herrerae TaxID=1293975 RepID=A0AA88WVQ6_9ASTE|nr:hypothetical protein RJ639_034842 [Escallonia herrerae]
MEGDLNTKFFHLSTIIRRRKNSIDLIKDKDGKWISSCEGIGICLTEHFQNLFQSSKTSFPADLEGLISPVLSENDISSLQKIPSISEITATLMKFDKLKAPGPNGMPALFYKTYWKTVNPEGNSPLQGNSPLAKTDGGNWIHGDLVLLRIADEPLRVVEGNVRRSRPVALVVGDDLDAVVLPHADARVGRAEIYPDRESVSFSGTKAEALVMISLENFAGSTFFSAHPETPSATASPIEGAHEEGIFPTPLNLFGGE